MSPNSEELVADLRRILGDGSPIVARHIACNPEWAALTGRALGLHTQLAAEFAQASADRLQPANIIGLGILAHTYNLMVDFLSTGYRGLFDVATYLARALHDAPGVVYQIGVDDAAVQRFLAGKDVSASRGRKAMLDYLRESGLKGVAERMDRQWSERNTALNKVSHLALNQVDRVFDENGGRLTALLGGRADCEQLRSLLQVAIDADCEFMIAAYTAWRSRLDATWPTAIHSLGEEARSLLGAP